MGEDRSRPGDQIRGEVTGESRRYHFHGRRKGHALHRHQAELIETLLPRLRIDLAVPISPGTGEVRLEIGFGGGEHLAHLAALHPEVTFLGAEPFVNGVAKLLAAIEEQGLGNIRIHDNDARHLLEALPAQSLASIYLLYPDPWPKARHHKRRIVNQDTLRQFHRVLRSGGSLLFASDSEDYLDWTIEHVRAHGGFERMPGDIRSPPEDWIETRYEAKARRDGRPPQYLHFLRI